MIITAYFYPVDMNFTEKKENACTSKEQDLHSRQKMISIANQEACTLDKNKDNFSSEIIGKMKYMAQMKN